MTPASGQRDPLFEQIADSVRGALAAGVYQPGEPVPSIRTQATNLLINPNTIKRAYELLEREGLIESRKGLGMYVTDKAASLARARVEQSMRDAFAHGVRLGRAAEVPRARADEVYRAAWTEARNSDGSPRADR